MKTDGKNRLGFRGLLSKHTKLTFFLMLMVSVHNLFADHIDIGIFESTTPGKIDVKVRPDFDIAGDETITAILYTVRWNDPSIEITTEFVFPFFIAPQGEPEENNGYYYQVFAAVPVNAMAMAANEEYIASSFTYTNGECASFEIIEDDWTQLNNGDFYIEFLGGNVTGIIFEPIVQFGSAGGEVLGGGTINLGESTGNLTLTAYSGNINTWQKRLNEGSWSDIASTNGLVDYAETPVIAGLWEYRCAIQEGDCPIVYSTFAEVIVMDTITNMYTYTEHKRKEVEIFCDGNKIYLRPSNSKSLNGDLKVYNLLGQKLEEKNIKGINDYNLLLNNSGILIITYIDKLTNTLYKEKVFVN